MEEDAQLFQLLHLTCGKKSLFRTSHQRGFVDSRHNVPDTYTVVHPSTQHLVPCRPYYSGDWLGVALQCQQWSPSCSPPRYK